MEGIRSYAMNENMGEARHQHVNQVWKVLIVWHPIPNHIGIHHYANSVLGHACVEGFISLAFGQS